jgi:hypothetical protein
MRSNRKPRVTWLLTVVYVVALIAPLPVSAGLGDSADSIRVDQLSMKARITSILSPRYAVHELTSPLGIVVREYVSSSGNIFAVSWHGPFAPDMRRFLAKRFELYSLEVQKQGARKLGHSALNIRTPFLVVEDVGRMRAYSGRAYDPSLLPAGVSIDEIR